MSTQAAPDILSSSSDEDDSGAKVGSVLSEGLNKIQAMFNLVLYCESSDKRAGGLSPKLKIKKDFMFKKKNQGGGDVEEDIEIVNVVDGGHFREPVHDDLINSLCGKTFAASTDRKISWAVKLFEE